MNLNINEDLLLKNLLVTAPEREQPQLLTSKPRHDIVTLKPTPGICVKTKDVQSEEKAFINVCTSEMVPEPEDISTSELVEILESDDPSNFKIPMSIGEGHQETDKMGKSCTAYDVIIHPSFLERINTDPIFNNFFMVATLESLDAKFSTNLDKNGWVVLKNRKYLGSLSHQSIRTSIPLVQELSTVRHWQPQTEGDPELFREVSTKFHKSKEEPVFDVYEKRLGSLRVLHINVDLPDVLNEDSLDVRLNKNRVVIESKKYFLDCILPVTIVTSSVKVCYARDTFELLIRASLV